MCHYQTLYYDDGTGYVIFCTRCNMLQLGFGNIGLSFYRQDFYRFQEWINKINGEYQDVIDPSPRKIAVPMPGDGIKLLLSGSEMKQLTLMLNTADTELCSLELISLFSNP